MDDYDQCRGCKKVRVCPKLIQMTAPELLAFCRARKDSLGLSYSDLESITGVPLGTIKRVFSKNMMDCKYETLRPIFAVLLSPEYNGDIRMPQDELASENAELKEKIAILQDQLKEIEPIRREEIAILRSELRHKNRVTAILGLCLLALGIIVVFEL